MVWLEVKYPSSELGQFHSPSIDLDFQVVRAMEKSKTNSHKRENSSTSILDLWIPCCTWSWWVRFVSHDDVSSLKNGGIVAEEDPELLQAESCNEINRWEGSGKADVDEIHEPFLNFFKLEGVESEVSKEMDRVSVDYYNPKPGDFVIGVVVYVILRFSIGFSHCCCSCRESILRFFWMSTSIFSLTKQNKERSFMLLFRCL